MASSANVPPGLKRIQPYLKIADDHEKKDIVISYWCRLYAVQSFLKFETKSRECSAFIYNVMDWLETAKRENKDNEAISNEVVAQAHIENYALKLFLWADGEDRAGRFNKNVVKAFYTAGLIYDVTATFGDPSEEVAHHKKYAKWKATYIHNCLKKGETPIPGPVAMENEEDYGDGIFPNVPSFPSVNNNPYNQPADNTSEPQQQDNPSNSNAHVPYPVGGLFAMDPQFTNLVPQSNNFIPQSTDFNPQAGNLMPPVAAGVHAPPSTPNGSNQPSPPTAAASDFTMPEGVAGGVKLTPADFQKAQKYCKWAGSALQYEDVPTAIENLQKCLVLLTTGKDQ